MKFGILQIIRIIIGIVFLTAGIAKSLDFPVFAENLNLLFGLQDDRFDFAVQALASAFVGVEIIVGGLLVAGYWQGITLPTTAGLLLVFLMSNFYQLNRGADGGCSCFGNIITTSYTEILLIDFVLLIMVMALLKSNPQNITPADV